MVNNLPRVRHAALSNRGMGRLALRLDFEEKLTPAEHGLILRGLGDYVLQQQGPVLQPEFRGHIVLLEPVVPTRDDSDFKAAAKQFGYIPPDGTLPFIDEDDRLVLSPPPLRQ